MKPASVTAVATFVLGLGAMALAQSSSPAAPAAPKKVTGGGGREADPIWNSNVGGTVWFNAVPGGVAVKASLKGLAAATTDSTCMSSATARPRTAPPPGALQPKGTPRRAHGCRSARR